MLSEIINIGIRKGLICSQNIDQNWEESERGNMKVQIGFGIRAISMAVTDRFCFYFSAIHLL